MKSLPERFGNLLVELRKAKRLSQSQLGIDCDLDRTFISLLERGERQPSLTTIFKLAKALGVTPSSIIKELEK
ncbi:MAG: helix-turn-helix transcriptional regulator [Bacteroidota bacterium]